MNLAEQTPPGETVAQPTIPTLKPYFPVEQLAQLAPDFPAVATQRALMAAGLATIPTGDDPSKMKKAAMPAGGTYKSILNRPTTTTGGVGVLTLGIDFDVEERECKLTSMVRLAEFLETRGIKSIGRPVLVETSSGGIHALYANDPLFRVRGRDKLFPCIDIRSGNPEEVSKADGSRDYHGYLATVGTGLRGDELAHAKSKPGRPATKKDPAYKVRDLSWPNYQVVPLALFPDPRQRLLAKLQEADPDLLAVPPVYEEAVLAAENKVDVPLSPMPEALIKLLVERHDSLDKGAAAASWPSKSDPQGVDDDLRAERTEEEMLALLQELKRLAPDNFTEMDLFVNLAAHIAAWNKGEAGRRVFDEVVFIGGQLRPDAAAYWESKADTEWKSAKRKGFACDKKGRPQGSVGLVDAVRRAKGETVGVDFQAAMATLNSRFIVVVDSAVSVHDFQLRRRWQTGQLHLANQENGASVFHDLIKFINGPKSYKAAAETFIRKARQWAGVRTEIEGVCVRDIFPYRPPQNPSYFYQEESLLRPEVRLIRNDELARKFLLRVAFACGGNYILFQWLTHWFANKFQRPMEVSKTIPVLSSLTHGGGRSWLMNEVPRALVPDHFIGTLKEEWLDKWTGEFDGKWLIVCEEVDKFKNQEQMVPMVAEIATSSTLQFTQKNEKATEAKPFIGSFIFASNRHLGVLQKSGQRRYVRIESSNFRQLANWPGGPQAFFDESYALIGTSENESANAIGAAGKNAIAYLMGSINPYRTSTRVFGFTQAIGESLTDAIDNPVRQFVEDLFMRQDEHFGSAEHLENGDLRFSGPYIYADYGQWLKDNRKGALVSKLQQTVYADAALLRTTTGKPFVEVGGSKKRKTFTMKMVNIREHLASLGAVEDTFTGADYAKMAQEVDDAYFAGSGGQFPPSSKPEDPLDACLWCVDKFWHEDYLPGLTATPRRNQTHVWKEDGYVLTKEETNENE